MYIRKKCNACGYWAVFELMIFCQKAVETCTHCRYSLRNIAWDREARKDFEDNRKLYEELCEKYPQLRNLNEPGDHVRIEED